MRVYTLLSLSLSGTHPAVTIPLWTDGYCWSRRPSPTGTFCSQEDSQAQKTRAREVQDYSQLIREESINMKYTNPATPLTHTILSPLCKLAYQHDDQFDRQASTSRNLKPRRPGQEHSRGCSANGSGYICRAPSSPVIGKLPVLTLTTSQRLVHKVGPACQ